MMSMRHSKHPQEDYRQVLVEMTSVGSFVSRTTDGTSKVKIGLFVSEETGCHGSQQCDEDFLKDVGYAIQFDASEITLLRKFVQGFLFEKMVNLLIKSYLSFRNT